MRLALEVQHEEAQGAVRARAQGAAQISTRSARCRPAAAAAAGGGGTQYTLFDPVSPYSIGTRESRDHGECNAASQQQYVIQTHSEDCRITRPQWSRARQTKNLPALKEARTAAVTAADGGNITVPDQPRGPSAPSVSSHNGKQPLE